MALFSLCVFFPIQISLCLADCHFSARICSSVFCHRSWLWLSWSFARLKVGQLPFFFKWHKFVSLYLAHMSPPWERKEEGSCGGMIWYELKLFPNRLHRVWSCPLFVWWTPFTSINPRRACIMLHQLFLLLVFLFFTVKCSANNNTGCIFSMTLRLKVPPPCYLWLVAGELFNSFPMQRHWHGPPEGPVCQCYSSSASSRRSLARRRDWKLWEEMTMLFVLRSTHWAGSGQHL